jgi:hypothetical protein
MASMFDSQTRGEFQTRIARLTPQAERRWGKMSPHQIVCHLSDQLRMALGTIQTTPIPGILRYSPVKQLAIGPLPWPHGAKSPPESWTTNPAEWTRDVATLRQLLDQFGSSTQQDNWPEHPIFGRMTRDLWGRLTCKHFDHHLRQFSV